MTRFRLPMIALALLISSNAWAELRTYDVDPQFQQEIFSALNNILNSSAPGVVNGASYGRVQLLPSGQLLVNAEPETLQQVEHVLEAIQTRAVSAAPRAELRYWAVLGNRTAAATQLGSPVPSALNDVLGELKRMHGDLQFRVLGTAALTTQSGQQGEIGGAKLQVEQTTFVQGDALNAELDLVLPWLPDGPITTLTVKTSLRRGEFVVLGESEIIGGGVDGPVFFIVHWPAAGAR